MKFAFVFPGQGSQSLGMMAAYGDSPVIRATFDEASAALGRDLWQLVTEGPAEALSQTVNTQPLMLTAGIAVWRLWQEKGGLTPAMVAVACGMPMATASSTSRYSRPLAQDMKNFTTGSLKTARTAGRSNRHAHSGGDHR